MLIKRVSKFDAVSDCSQEYRVKNVSEKGCHEVYHYKKGTWSIGAGGKSIVNKIN
jgi:hypothetical protein